MKKKYLYTILIGCCSLLATAFNSYSQNTSSGSSETRNHADNIGSEQDQQDDKDNKSPEGMGSMNTGTISSESIPLDLHSVLKNNANEMISMKMVGQLDIDFAKMMAQHHRGGIKMSQVYLQSGQNRQLRELATNIVNEQNKEVNKLESFHGGKSQKVKNEAPSKLLIVPIKKIVSDNHESHLAGGIDKEFASLMIQHYQAGVEMADIEIEKGINAEMKETAKKIKSEQLKEIKVLENWLSKSK